MWCFSLQYKWCWESCQKKITGKKSLPKLKGWLNKKKKTNHLYCLHFPLNPINLLMFLSWCGITSNSWFNCFGDPELSLWHSQRVIRCFSVSLCNAGFSSEPKFVFPNGFTHVRACSLVAFNKLKYLTLQVGQGRTTHEAGYHSPEDEEKFAQWAAGSLAFTLDCF